MFLDNLLWQDEMRLRLVGPKLFEASIKWADPWACATLQLITPLGMHSINLPNFFTHQPTYESGHFYFLFFFYFTISNSNYVNLCKMQPGWMLLLLSRMPFSTQHSFLFRLLERDKVSKIKKSFFTKSSRVDFNL